MATGDDSNDPAIICPSYCSKNYVQTCPQPCISYCPSICAAYPPSPVPSSSVLNFLQDIPNSKVSPMLFVTVSLSAIAAAFVLFTFLAICRFCKTWCNRRRRRRPRWPEYRDDRFDTDRYQDPGPILDHPIWHIRTVGLNPSIINKIPVVRYKKGDSRIEGEDCAVCLSEFQDDESLRILPKCSHPFHLPCIDTWLRSHKNCPICRSGIVENSMIFQSGDRSAQISEEDEINRESETATENNEHDSEIRIESHDSNGSVTGQKMDDTSNGGRTVSMGDFDRNPVVERGEMSERWLMETGASSSSSPPLRFRDQLLAMQSI